MKFQMLMNMKMAMKMKIDFALVACLDININSLYSWLLVGCFIRTWASLFVVISVVSVRHCVDIIYKSFMFCRFNGIRLEVFIVRSFYLGL